VISSGLKEAKIQSSEGERQEAVNKSEGEKQKRINEANGKAAEIRLVAEASAEGARLVAEALQKPGGELAMRTQLVEAYLVELGKIIETADVSVVPREIANLQAVVQGVARVTRATQS
jgi:regulator of protease activity HflC (stomatin/prohibitin superfamily)